MRFSPSEGRIVTLIGTMRTRKNDKGPAPARKCPGHDPVVIHEEADEEMTLETMRGVEEIFADMLFDAWKKRKGVK